MFKETENEQKEAGVGPLKTLIGDFTESEKIKIKLFKEERSSKGAQDLLRFISVYDHQKNSGRRKWANEQDLIKLVSGWA